MKILLYSALLALVLSCKGTEPDTVAPEYQDWYTLRAPVDREIQGVWGNFDRTLLIVTRTNVYRSTDKGENWQEVLPFQNHGMFSIVQQQDTLFTMTGLANGQFLTNASNYSVDDGKTWKAYTRHNPAFEISSSSGQAINKFSISPVVNSSGVSYKINQVFLDGPTATTGVFETPGVVTSDGRRIDLPQLHQLRSLYLDSQQRLYIAATDAVCGRGLSGKSFSFCNSKNGRGVVYIAKKSRL
jgi:hypothetical protein